MEESLNICYSTTCVKALFFTGGEESMVIGAVGVWDWFLGLFLWE